MTDQIGLRWTGWDDSTWDLRNGPVIVLPGISNLLDMADSEVFVRRSTAIDGQRVTGARMLERSGLLPVLIDADRSDADWLTLERSFRRSLHPTRKGMLTAIAPDGSERHLFLRVPKDGDDSEQDPAARRHSVAPLRVVADDPWWVGPELTQRFSNGSSPVNFYGPTGFGPPFFLGASNTAASARLRNPGDVPAWVRYTLVGPLPSWRVRLNGGLVSSRAAIAPGEVLVIDTAPWLKVAYLYTPDGAQRATRTHLASWQFKPVFEESWFGGDVPLEVELGGTGSLEVALTPRYRRAVT